MKKLELKSKNLRDFSFYRQEIRVLKEKRPDSIPIAKFAPWSKESDHLVV